MDDSTAKKKIDSISNLVEKGARFDTLAAKLSDDQGSKEKGGRPGLFHGRPDGERILGLLF